MDSLAGFHEIIADVFPEVAEQLAKLAERYVLKEGENRREEVVNKSEWCENDSLNIEFGAEQSSKEALDPTEESADEVE